MGAPGADLLKPVSMAEVAAMHRPVEAAKAAALAANIAYAKELNQERNSRQKTDEQIVKEVAEAPEILPSQTTSISGQQDIARFGGEGATLDPANGKAIEKPNLTNPQKDRLARGKEAVENVSAVLFYVDLLNEPGTDLDAKVTALAAKNKSFAALGITTGAQLTDRATESMMKDPGIVKLLEKMPEITPGTALTDDQKKEIVLNAMLTNDKFRNILSQNFQLAREALLKLPTVTPEGRAKHDADKAKADQTVKDKVAALKAQLARTTNTTIQGLDEGVITDLVLKSNSEADFKKHLAITIGVDATHIAQVLSILEEQKTLVDLNTRLRTATDAGQISSLKTLKSDAEARIQTAEGLVGGKPVADADIIKYQEVVAVVDQVAVKSNVNDAVNASIESARLTSIIAGLPPGVDISPNLDTRLGQEDKIINTLNALLGKSLGQEWKKEMEEANISRAELIKKKIEMAGTDAEKELIRRMETEYVEFDAANRSTTIHGDRIMEGARLLTLKDPGLMIAIARDMGLLGTQDQANAIIETLLKPDVDKKTGKNNNNALAQKTAIDKLLSSLKTGSPEKYAVLEKALKDHGSEYRQKVYGSYLTMDDYIKEGGMLGIAIRFGRKINYEGSPRGIVEKMTGKGDQTFNYEELKELFMYCKADIDAAIITNKDAGTFMRNMERKGMVGNPDMLKKLAFFLFVILGLTGGGIAGGLGVGGMAGGLGAGAGAGLGAGLGAGAGALGNKGLDAMTV